MTESTHFKHDELKCKCGCNVNNIDPIALEALERIRIAFGKPITLTSAFRCAGHPNERVKEKPGTHNRGIAFDISVSWGRDRMTLIELALKNGFKGFGFAKGFLHIDYRDGDVTSWTY